jgi:hypothetical protein
MELRVGRLGEIRYSSLSLEDMHLYRTRFETLLNRVSGKLIFVSDLRGVEAVSPEVEREGIELMRAATPRIERAAMLVSSRGQFGVQMLRATTAATIQGEGPADLRRVFSSAMEIERWLGEVLTAEERARLHYFLLMRPTIPML